MTRAFTSTVHPFDFSRVSGHDFERLVFAFLLRRWSWRSLDWFGQTGDDGGRDIVGERDDDRGERERVVVACANWQAMTVTKAVEDVEKLCKPERPHAVIVVAGGAMSAASKTKVRDFAKTLGVYDTEVWSGSEFEELLRFHAESVAARFFQGASLPDEPSALRDFVRVVAPDEPEALRLVARAFDRPAFYTPFRQESSIPASRRALSDTVEALNTGIYRSRDGTEIRRLPSRHDFASTATRDALEALTRNVVDLRTAFDDFLRSGAVTPCACTVPDCPVFMATSGAVDELNELRAAILDGVATSTGVKVGHLLRP